MQDTMKLFHQLWFLEQDRSLHQILEVGIHASTDAGILRRPLTTGDVDMIADLITQQHNTTGISKWLSS